MSNTDGPLKDKILTALPQLDGPTLQAIVSAAKGLLANRAGTLATTSNDPQAWLYEALTATLRVTYPPDWHATPTGRLFAQHAPRLLKFYEANFEHIITKRIAALALMRWSFEMLRDYLFKNHIPLSTGAMVRNMDKIPDLFEHHFPGYLTAGLGALIAQHIMEREPYNAG